jgi:TPR repeat protein
MAADRGHADAQVAFGLCYWKGEVVPEDDAEAIRWWQKAAEQDHEMAKVRISMCYQDRGDLLEAFKWLKLATDQNEIWEGKLNHLRSSLTKEQIVEAEKRYREFQSSKK